MTIGDLINGTWTWGQLFSDIAPLVLVAASAFFAGYQRGRRIETERHAAAMDLAFGGYLEASGEDQ